MTDCEFCGGKGVVWFGAQGYDFEYPCPECSEGEKGDEKVYDGRL
jgi:hypothetical protein